MISVGQVFPQVEIKEFVDVAQEGCPIGPRALQTQSELAGKSVVIVGVPGAFTPTCSETHIPAYLSKVAEFKQKGIDEIWCVSVNDAFVMHAWGKALGVGQDIRMMADGSAVLAKALGLTLDLTAAGLGLRSCRFAVWVVDGVVKVLNVDASGKLEHSDALSLLKQI